MHTRRARRLRASCRVFSRDLANVFIRKVDMLRNYRSVDEPDFHIRATAAALHQRGELYQVER